MTGPQLDQAARSDVTIDDIAKGLEAAAAEAKRAEEEAKAAEAAKAAAAVAPQVDPQRKALEESLRISEDARRRAEAELAAKAAAPAAEPAAPAAPKELSREELSAMFQQDPLAAMDYMSAKSLKSLEDNIARRLAPLVAGGATTAEEQARQKYPDEFKIFGDEIKSFVAAAADKSLWSVPKNWDDLISWMRGRPGNFEKLVEFRTERTKEQAASAAQAAQAASAGGHAGGTIRTPPPAGDGALDATEREIVKELSRAGVLTSDEPEKEYLHWRRLGNA